MVATVISPERWVAAARAASPSSHGVEKTRWSFAEIAERPHSRAASTVPITRSTDWPLPPPNSIRGRCTPILTPSVAVEASPSRAVWRLRVRTA